MSKNGEERPGWIDFKALKASLDVDVIVEGFKLSDTLLKKEDEWIGFCPFHPEKGKNDSFHLSAEKKAFHCFCCKRKGSALDFVHQYMTYKGDSVDLRGAALWIEGQMRLDKSHKIKDERAEMERQDLGEQDARQIAEEVQQDRPEAVAVDSSGVFVDFAEACRLVTVGEAHAGQFVAVRVERLLEVFGQLSPRKQAEKQDKERARKEGK